MKYDFNKVQDRIGSDSIKWEKQLKFWYKDRTSSFLDR